MSNNSTIEPSDQPSTTVKKGMCQQPVPLLVDEYPSAIHDENRYPTIQELVEHW